MSLGEVKMREQNLPVLTKEVAILDQSVKLIGERLQYRDESEQAGPEPMDATGSGLGEELKGQILALRRVRQNLEKMLPAVDAIVKMVTP